MARQNVVRIGKRIQHQLARVLVFPCVSSLVIRLMLMNLAEQKSRRLAWRGEGDRERVDKLEEK